jgi:hypothetical protein
MGNYLMAASYTGKTEVVPVVRTHLYLIHLLPFYRPNRPEYDEQNPPDKQSSESPHDLKRIKQHGHHVHAGFPALHVRIHNRKRRRDARKCRRGAQTRGKAILMEPAARPCAHYPAPSPLSLPAR